LLQLNSQLVQQKNSPNFSPKNWVDPKIIYVAFSLFCLIIFEKVFMQIRQVSL
jgi:hypothetical protein